MLRLRGRVGIERPPSQGVARSCARDALRSCVNLLSFGYAPNSHAG